MNQFRVVWSLVFCFSALLSLSNARAEVLGDPHVYKVIGDKELQLFVTKPDGWSAEDKRPAVVFFHGGAWIGGEAGQFTEHSSYFASRGLVCFQIDYRLLKKKSKQPPITCTEDARSAMRWIRSRSNQFGIDPNRIASAGGSAGGHLAAFVGTVDEKTANGTTAGGTTTPNASKDGNDSLRVSSKSNAMLLFNPVYNNGPGGGWGQARVKDRYPEFSPAHNLSADDPPSIVFLGDNDKLIPVAVAEKFRDDCKAVGVRSELHLYKGQPHGFFNHKNDDGKWYRKTVVAADRFLASLGWLEGEPTLESDPE